MLDEVHKPEKQLELVRRIFEIYINKARASAIVDITFSKFGGLDNEEKTKLLSRLHCVVFEVPEFQFGQDTDASESVLERLRREFVDKFITPLEEVAGKVGMLGNISFFAPDEWEENANGMPEIGCVVVYDLAGNQEVAVHLEMGSPERVGQEARFVYDDERGTELYSVSDAFKELVKILEEQGRMIPKI